MSPRGARHAALEAGEKRYFTGNACPQGHVAERHVANGKCCECTAEWKASNGEKCRATDRRRSARNAGARRLKDREAYRTNPEKFRAKAREYARRKKHERRAYAKIYFARADVRERRRAYRAEYTRLPHVVERRRDLCNARLQADPQYRLNQRMRCRMHVLLRRCGLAKARRRWAEIVGYSVEKLRLHIERQFAPGMSWLNAGEWDIDHIVPLASFRFASIDDPEFRAAWAITNLRPLWSSENKAKKDKRLYLV